MKKIIVFFSVMFLCFCQMAFTQWPCRPDQSVAISTNAGNQWNVRIASDGASGAILVWQDRRGGAIDKLYVQRVNAVGETMWQDGGIQLSTTEGYQYNPDIIPDTSGGAYIVWQDNRSSSSYDIYAQRISSGGHLLWDTPGEVVCNAVGHQYNPKIISDGIGGVVIVWQDKRNGQFDIYAQRLNAAGVPAWQQNGVAVCTAPFDQVEPKVVSSEGGSVIIAWTDHRNSSGFSDIYAQRLLANGTVAWATNGVPICTEINSQWNIQIASDTSGGAIIVWQDRRMSSVDRIYAQRINTVGNVQWTTNGVHLSSSSGTQSQPKVAPDGSGGAVVVWQDNRRGNDVDIYGQRINYGGALLWVASALPVSVASGHQYNPQLIVDKSSVLVCWQDKRSGNFDIYAQRINLNGGRHWELNGIPIAIAVSEQINLEIASDLYQGFVVTWMDYRSGTGYTDLYAHRIGANGKLAGGCYRTFTQDNFALTSVRYYSRTRGAFAMPNAGNVRDTIFRRGLYPNGLVTGIDRSDSARHYGWQVFSRGYYVRHALPQKSVPRPYDFIRRRAFVGQRKNYSASRYNNSLVGELIALKLNIGASDAGITAPGFGDILFYDPTLGSHPLNRRSLRNIAYYADSILTMWKWFRGVNYAQIDSVLRRINAAFTSTMDTISAVPLSIKSVKSLSAVPFLIANPDTTLVAVTVQSSTFVEESQETYSLLQNYPNPFNPFTTIEFNVLEPSYTSLKVYNVLGQEVATLLDRVVMEEGIHLVDFDGSGLASGVYFYRLTIEPLSESRVYSFINKMLLVK